MKWKRSEWQSNLKQEKDNDNHNSTIFFSEFQMFILYTYLQNIFIFMLLPIVKISTRSVQNQRFPHLGAQLLEMWKKLPTSELKCRLSSNFSTIWSHCLFFLAPSSVNIRTNHFVYKIYRHHSHYWYIRDCFW